MSLRKVLLGLAACTTLFAGPSTAATFNITIDSVGAGTFDAPPGGGPLAASNITFNSQSYTYITGPLGGPAIYDSTINRILGYVFSSPSTPTLYLLFDGSGVKTGGCQTGSFNPFFTGGVIPCFITIIPSAYTVTAASPVPVPAALPLLATGLGALGVIGWRRKRKLAQSQA